MRAALTELDATIRLAIAALVGLGVGLEREWSRQVRGREPRFAGLRTFFMLGLVGGSAGLLLTLGHEASAAALVLGGTALAAAAYVVATRRGAQDGAAQDGTTEVAALLVVGLGVLAGLGWLVLASAVASLVVLALSEKERLHALVRHLRADELAAAMRFSVLALVVLPLLPANVQWGGVHAQPRALWVIVLFFSALNFAGFVLRRQVGPGRGFGVLGMLGGLISSTAVTFDFSRRSQRDPAIARPLAYGVVGACTVLIPRVLVVSAAFNYRVSLALLPLLLAPMLIGLWIVRREWNAQSAAPGDVGTGDASDSSPLRLGMAIRMAILFQVAMTAIEYVRSTWATAGLYVTAVALGLTDVDALTVGMSRPAAALPVMLAARAIAIGILSNTLFKLGLSLVLGEPRFRRSAGMGLAGMAAAAAGAIWVFA